MVTCPECDADIELSEDDMEELAVGDPWDCDACGSRLRVASLDPLEFESEDEDEDEEDEEAAETGEEKAEGEEDEDDELEDEDGDEPGEDWDE